MPTLNGIAQKIEALEARVNALEAGRNFAPQESSGHSFPKKTLFTFLFSIFAFLFGDNHINLLGIDAFFWRALGSIGMWIFGLVFVIRFFFWLLSLSKNQSIPSSQKIPLAPKHPLKTEKDSSKRYFLTEEFFGKNLFTKIGVGLFTLGIALFVKYSFENGWIGPLGRVTLGMISGTIFVALGDYLSAKYKNYALTMMGGGFAMMYFAIFSARNFYAAEIGLDANLAFFILIFITIAAAFLAHRHRSEVFALFALGGGFATPFLINGGDNVVELLSYILLLDLAVLFLAAHHRWTILSVSVFLASFFLSTGNFLKITHSLGTLFLAAFFLAAFFFVFVGFSLANVFGKKENFSPIIFSLSFFAPIFYFGQMMEFFHKYHLEAYRGLFTLGLAAIYVMIGLFAHSRKSDQRILESFFGAALSFIAAAIYLQANEFWVPVLWAFEGGVLFFLGQKNKWKIWKLGAVLLGISTLWYFGKIFHSHSDTLLVNNRVAVGATLVAIFAALQWKFKNNPLAAVFRSLILLIPICIGWAEITDFFRGEIIGHQYKMKIGLGHSLFLALYASFFFAIGSVRNVSMYRLAAIGIFLFAIFKVLTYDLWELGDLYRIFSVLSLGGILLGVGFLYHRNQEFFFPKKL